MRFFSDHPLTDRLEDRMIDLTHMENLLRVLEHFLDNYIVLPDEDESERRHAAEMRNQATGLVVTCRLGLATISRDLDAILKAMAETLPEEAGS